MHRLGTVADCCVYAALDIDVEIRLLNCSGLNEEDDDSFLRRVQIEDEDCGGIDNTSDMTA